MSFKRSLEDELGNARVALQAAADEMERGRQHFEAAKSEATKIQGSIDMLEHLIQKFELEESLDNGVTEQSSAAPGSDDEESGS